jgi:predicted Zn finger-like uncharacterized protein
MRITCPHCGYGKEIEAEQLPPRATRATCPNCRQSFPLQREEPTADRAPETELSASPVSGPQQTPATSRQVGTEALPKAGFWMRVVATLIDAFIVLVLQFLFSALLAAAGVGQAGDLGNLALLIQIFGTILSAAYYVVFIGHCGQTPGKMALRIKVIRRDGSAISYGRAAFREIPAKFLSGIIFGIGYLMVAFDDQKQGLHDRLADTYVIKL